MPAKWEKSTRTRDASIEIKVNVSSSHVVLMSKQGSYGHKAKCAIRIPSRLVGIRIFQDEEMDFYPCILLHSRAATTLELDEMLHLKHSNLKRVVFFSSEQWPSSVLDGRFSDQATGYSSQAHSFSIFLSTKTFTRVTKHQPSSTAGYIDRAEK